MNLETSDAHMMESAESLSASLLSVLLWFFVSFVSLSAIVNSILLRRSKFWIYAIVLSQSRFSSRSCERTS
jgi:peptidoglycan biosynthesis protein MviN/MurJ (putative lipid II flippase)